MMNAAAAIACALLCLSSGAQLVSGQNDAKVTVTTTFALYGSSVEPFDNSKESAVKSAIVQSAGHGVEDGDVSVSVVQTYQKQQQSGRRLLQQQLVQPGVLLQVDVDTTQSSAPEVQQAIASAIGNNQIVNIFKNSGQQADYAQVASQGTTSGSSGGSGSSNSKGGSGGFPSWAIAVVVILVLLLLAIVTGFFVYRKCARRRAVKANELDAGGYFSSSKPAGKSSLVRPAKTSILGTNKSDSSSPVDLGTSSMDGFRGIYGSPSFGANSGSTRSPSASWASPALSAPEGASTPNPIYVPPAAPSSSPYKPTRAGRLIDNIRGIDDI